MSKKYESLQLLKFFFENTLANTNSIEKSNEEVISNLKQFNNNSDEFLTIVTNMDVFKVTDPINNLLYDLFLTVEDIYTDRMDLQNPQQLNERINTINKESANALTIINPILDTMNNELQPKKNKM